MFEYLIGKKIMIVNLKDEPADSPYIGKTGVVLTTGNDPWHDGYIRGTWGGISLYPGVDKFQVID